MRLPPWHGVANPIRECRQQSWFTMRREKNRQSNIGRCLLQIVGKYTSAPRVITLLPNRLHIDKRRQADAFMCPHTQRDFASVDR